MCASELSIKKAKKHKSSIEYCGCGCIMLFCNGVVFLSGSSSRSLDPCHLAHIQSTHFRPFLFIYHNILSVSCARFEVWTILCAAYTMRYLIVIIIIVRLNVATITCFAFIRHSTHNAIVDNTCIEFVRQEMFIIPKHIRWVCILFLSHSSTHSVTVLDACLPFQKAIGVCALCDHEVFGIFGSSLPASQQCCNHVLLMLFVFSENERQMYSSFTFFI